eukprot:PITA_21490
MVTVEEKSTMELKNSSSTDLIVSCGMRTQKCEGFWIQANTILAVKVTQREFQPQQDEIFLASLPKTVTTWCKALLHTIVRYWTEDTNFGASVEDRSPHSLVPTMEAYLFDSIVEHQQYDVSIFSKFPSLRVLHTHLPLSLLPPPVSLFAASVLSYWRESRWDPNKLMFVTYEDLQADCVGCIKKLGLFLGCSPQLVEENVVVIVEKCSSQSLSIAEVNKTSRGLENKIRMPYHSFFREGKVDEWKKHFTPQMEERTYLEIEQKLNNEGLHFKYSL